MTSRRIEWLLSEGVTMAMVAARPLTRESVHFPR
jgi:hypothetical protein